MCCICFKSLSAQDFLIMIVIHSNFLFGMHGFRDYELLLKAGYDFIVISPRGRVEVSCVSTTTADANNKAKPCRAACEKFAHD